MHIMHVQKCFVSSSVMIRNEMGHKPLLHWFPIIEAQDKSTSSVNAPMTVVVIVMLSCLRWQCYPFMNVHCGQPWPHSKVSSHLSSFVYSFISSPMSKVMLWYSSFFFANFSISGWNEIFVGHYVGSAVFKKYRIELKILYLSHSIEIIQIPTG